jgi:MarR family transcriptional regulator, organic hydroperoxide resistance regulator
MAMTRSITDEIKQTRPFRTRSQEATVALMRTVHLLRRQADAVVAAEDLTLQQYNVLRILRGARAPLPTMEISVRMIEPSCGITRLIGTLEERGFVKREQWPGDRRQVLCQITAAGLRVLERLEEPMNRLDDATTGNLPSERVEALLEILGEIRENAEKNSPLE